MAEKKPKGPPTLDRKIHFFRVDAGKSADGYPVSFDPRPALSKIHNLPFSDKNGRYLGGLEETALCAWVDDQRNRPKMRFGQIRRAGLPQIEETGNLSDLDLAANAGLVEPVHVVFFPDSIAGADFNFYGPRLNRLGYYLRVKAGDPTPLTHFEPLLRLDVINQLNTLQDVRLFDLKIRPSFIDAVRDADKDLGLAFDAAIQLGKCDQIEVLMRPTKDDQTIRYKVGEIVGGAMSLGRKLVTIAKRLGKREELKTEATKFIIRGKREDTGRVESIDMLHDHLISHKQILKHGERSRALDPSSAYAAIEMAYEELKDELIAAASIAQ